jgi:Periplasmic binding protein
MRATMTTRKSNSARPIARRTLIVGAATSGAILAARFPTPAIAQQKTVKLGYVSPQTGPLAAFAEADNFTVAAFREATKGGIKVGNSSHPVEVVVKDSQSNPNRAAQVAKDLIVQDKVDLVLVASTPETTNPVSTQCEIEEQPCVSTMAPWQPWFIGRHLRNWAINSPTRAGIRTSPTISRRKSTPSRTPMRDHHRRRPAARFHDVLEAGAAAGLQAQGGLGRQGDPFPGCTPGARQGRQQPLLCLLKFLCSVGRGDGEDEGKLFIL